MKLQRVKSIRIQITVLLNEADARRFEAAAEVFKTSTAAATFRRLLDVTEERVSGPYPYPREGSDAKPG